MSDRKNNPNIHLKEFIMKAETMKEIQDYQKNNNRTEEGRFIGLYEFLGDLLKLGWKTYREDK